MARNIVQVLDIGSGNIKALVAERQNNGELRVLGASLVPSTGMRKGNVSSEENLVPKIRETAREAERTSGIPFRSVFVSFGSPALGFLKSRGRIAISRADGEVASHDVERVIRQAQPSQNLLANKEIIENFGLNYTVDSELSVKDPVGNKGENLEAEVLFLTALKQPLRELIKAVESSGLAIEDLIPSPLATARALLDERAGEVGALVLDLGAETMTLGVFEENMPFAVASFPFGGSHITNDIALGFQVSLAEAERIKLSGESPEVGTPSRKKLENIIEARLEDMFELVEGHLKKIGRAELLPGGVYLSGGGSKISGLQEFSKKYLRLPTELGRCHEVEAGHKLSDPVWNTALGLALMGLGGDKNHKHQRKTTPSQIRRKISSWFKSLIP